MTIKVSALFTMSPLFSPKIVFFRSSISKCIKGRSTEIRDHMSHISLKNLLSILLDSCLADFFVMISDLFRLFRDPVFS